MELTKTSKDIQGRIKICDLYQMREKRLFVG